jgi:hypothetical protein
MAMTFEAEIYKVSIETKPTAKGSYKCATVSGKDLSANRPFEKKVMSFGPSERAFLVLAQNLSGGKFTIEQDKLNDFWTWINMTPSEGVAASPPASSSYQAAPSTNKAADNNRFETSDERQAKQRYIVRQSSLSNALTFLELCGSKKPLVAEVIGIAKQFESYVFDEYTPEIERPSRAGGGTAGAGAAVGIDLDDDIPF